MKNTRKRIEDKPSRTAAWTCTCRALSFLESESQYKSEDHIAPELLPRFLQLLFRVNLFRKLFISNLIPDGMYEYVIARTKFFDSVIESAILKGFKQIIVFGAGYDSRGIRFLSGEEDIKVYELDAPRTQRAKIEQLKKRGVRLHSNVVFIPINFNKEALKDKLIGAGFDKEKKSLFVLEGLTMYLNQKAIDSTFSLIDAFSSANSEIVFDYVLLSVLKRENTLFGEEEIYETVKNANEEWSFGIDAGQVDLFLEEYGFTVEENLNHGDLEERYFKKASKMGGQINATHCIVHAKYARE